MSTSKRLLLGSFLRNADLFVALAVTFLVTPLIVRTLGNRMYGFWTLIGTFLGYYGLMDFGLSSAASRYISQSLGKGDDEDLNRVANNAFFLFSLMGAAAVLVTLASVAGCPFFIREPAEIALFRKIILLLGAATAIGFPTKVYSGILGSYLRFDLIAYLSIGRNLISNAVLYFYLLRGCGIMEVAVITFTVNLLQNAALCALCVSRYPHVKIVCFRFDAASIRMMFNHSWKTFLCQVGELLRFKLDSVVIAAFLSVSLVTPYAVGARLVDGFVQLVLGSVGMMLPVFSRYEGRGDFEAIKKALLMVTRLSAILSAFVGFSILFYAPAFIRRWMGPGFESSSAVAAILCVGFILHLPQSPGVQLLTALSKHESYAALNAVEGVANLALSLIFVKYYGMYGVALGTAVEMIVFKLFVQPFYICRVIRLPVRVYVVDMILGTLAKAGVPLGLYFFMIRGLVLPEYARLGACIAAQTALFIPAAYFLIISREERSFIKGLASSFFQTAALKPAAGLNAA